jgi:hypothetical protein
MGYFVRKFNKKRVKFIVQLCFPHLLTFSNDARDFDKPKWVKQNRKYPIDPPAELLAYHDSLCEISQKYQYRLQVIPPTFNIIEFTELKLPKTTSTVVEYTVKSPFRSTNLTKT